MNIPFAIIPYRNGWLISLSIHCSKQVPKLSFGTPGVQLANDVEKTAAHRANNQQRGSRGTPSVIQRFTANNPDALLQCAQTWPIPRTIGREHFRCHAA